MTHHQVILTRRAAKQLNKAANYLKPLARALADTPADAAQVTSAQQAITAAFRRLSSLTTYSPTRVVEGGSHVE